VPGDIEVVVDLLRVLPRTLRGNNSGCVATSKPDWKAGSKAPQIIGFRPGTGGTAGVGYLKQAVGRPFFPELWDLRTEL